MSTIRNQRYHIHANLSFAILVAEILLLISARFDPGTVGTQFTIDDEWKSCIHDYVYEECKDRKKNVDDVQKNDKMQKVVKMMMKKTQYEEKYWKVNKLLNCFDGTQSQIFSSTSASL